jgi:hypothetical protein
MVRWGEEVDGAVCYPLHDGQADVIRSRARFTLALAGTGGGKTAVGPLWTMKQIKRVLDAVDRGERDLRTMPVMGMVVAPTHQIKERATAPTLVTMFKGTDLEGEYVPSRLRYILPGYWQPNAQHDPDDPDSEEHTWVESMGTIWVLSADNPGGLEGGQFDFVWGDEPGQFKYDAHVAIEGRTGARQAPVLYTTTPYGINWLKYRFVDKWKAGDKDYYVRQWSSIKNPAYPREEYDRAKRTLSPQRFAQRYDGLLVRMSGLVYPDLDTCKVKLADWPQNLEGVNHGAIDFGWQDPFCALAATLDWDDHLWVWYCRYKRVTPLAKHAEALPADVTWYCDPSRPDNINELRTAGHAARKAMNSIILGVDAVNTRVYENKLHILETCNPVFAESEEYRYPEKDDETVGDKPVPGFDHAMDTLRYLVTGVDKRKIAARD